MQIATMNTGPIYVPSRDTKWIANDSKTLSFSSLMQAVIDGKATVTQETAEQKQSESSCDCNSSMKQCKCGRGKETDEVSEAKKSGIEACMDCPNRKSGQCDLWNDETENDIFNLLPVNTAQADAVKILDLQAVIEVIARIPPEDDYTNAYDYIRKKFINADNKMSI